MILNFSLLSIPALRSSPNLFSNSKDGPLNKTLRSIPDRLPPLSGKSKYSIIHLRFRQSIPAARPHDRKHTSFGILRTRQLKYNCGNRHRSFQRFEPMKDGRSIKIIKQYQMKHVHLPIRCVMKKRFIPVCLTCKLFQDRVKSRTLFFVPKQFWQDRQFWGSSFH